MRIMQTLKLLFSKITDDDPIYEKKDVVENIFVFRMLLVWHLLYTFVFILNCLNIFIVDKHIFAVGQLQKNTVPLMNVYHVHDKLAVNG